MALDGPWDRCQTGHGQGGQMKTWSISWLYRTLTLEQAGLSDEVIEAQVQSLIEPPARNPRDRERDPRLLYKQREAVAQQIIE